ncbi:cytidine deaminase [Rubrobacter marinus]|uniref:Cytidine deaminase n=1 Tax=Rubrobacter marinus TaxID=2653852 RepID=A0A6G8PXA1_9ACTN|nr:cytidine deaminase [Rubrobacter marinus]QIN78815.1 cytidine deaminase [Rubrobacter marinus]
MELRDAIDAARAVSRQAYAPYSGFRVGAAIVTEGGALYDGCNVENASFGLSICAERGAVMKMIADAPPDDHGIRLVAVVSPNTAPCFPCGACRQVLREFGCEEVVVLDAEGNPRRYPFEEILPNSFGPEAL